MSQTQLPAENKIFKQLPLKILLISVLFIISLFIFSFIADKIVIGNEETFDNEVFSLFSSYTTPALIKVMNMFTFFGSVEFLIPAYLILIIYFIRQKQVRFAIDIAVIALSSTALVFALKYIFQRQRPELPVIRTFATYSFPSGHMLSSFVFCSILAFIIARLKCKIVYKRLFVVLLFFLAVIIGISRIILRAHYPTDIIASFCLGIAWVIGSFFILKKIDRQYIINKKA